MEPAGSLRSRGRSMISPWPWRVRKKTRRCAGGGAEPFPGLRRGNAHPSCRGPQGNVGWGRKLANCHSSIEDAVEALVVERTGSRRELLAKGARVNRDAVCLNGLTVAPHFDEGEVVLAVHLCYGLEAKVAAIPSTVLSKLLDDGGTVLPLWRNDVDVGDDCHCRPTLNRADRPNRKWEMGPHISGCVLDGPDLLMEPERCGRLSVSIGCSLILPCFKKHELVRLTEALEGLRPQIAGLRTHGVPEFPHRLCPVLCCGRRHLQIGNDVAGALRDRWWCRGSLGVGGKAHGPSIRHRREQQQNEALHVSSAMRSPNLRPSLSLRAPMTSTSGTGFP